jgi:hypothetical protein
MNVNLSDLQNKKGKKTLVALSHLFQMFVLPMMLLDVGLEPEP